MQKYKIISFPLEFVLTLMNKWKVMILLRELQETGCVLFAYKNFPLWLMGDPRW
jgi:hypothetical protein